MSGRVGAHREVVQPGHRRTDRVGPAERTRRAAKIRVSNYEAGDRWETRWDNDPTDSNPDHAYIWLRFDGLTRADRIRMTEETAW